MSSDLTGLPASALARLNASANMQSIAVKLINIPDGLKNNPAPVKLQGTVAGQNPDGSVQLKTDRGIINLMLKDKQPLPQGQRVEIEIPAGRAPQQAQIRQAPPETAPQTSTPTPASTTAPSLASQLAQQPLSSSAAAAALKLDRASNVRPTEIEDALKAATTKLSDLAGVKAPPAPLQAGQNVRLLPVLANQGQAVPLQPGQIAALPQDMLLSALTSMIENLPQDQQAAKAQLVGLLARMNLSSLQIPSTDGKTPPALPQSVQTLLQQLDTPDEPGAVKLPTETVRYTPISNFTSSKPVDVQISAFMTVPLRAGTPAPVLPGQIQLPVTPGTAQASPLPTTPATAPTLPSQVLPAQVTGFTSQNQPVISLPLPTTGQPQTYIGQFQAGNLQVGSPILVSLLPETPTATAPTLPQAPASPVPLGTWMQPGSWDSMTDLLQTLHQVNPAAAHSLTQILPSPSQPQNLGGLALLFLSVLKSGDLESWLPPQMAMMLRQVGKSDALRAVTSDVAQTARTETASLPQEWRATMLPLYHDQQIYKVPLYYKRQQEDDDTKDGKAKRNRLMRFLFDLKLARMGNVQIDGFMQTQRLDMIMRTKSPLSVPMQRTMQGLYVTAMEKSNLAGDLTFQFKPEHWVSIDIPVTKEELGVRA